MSKNKRVIALILTIVLTFSIDISFVKAATFNDLNQSGMFLKQNTNYTCTLSAATMMVRRASLATGNANWASITESSMRGTAWLEGSGLYYNFTYAGISVKHTSLVGGDGNTSQVISLLNEHPEGIVIYDRDKPHAILVTDYTDGIFYCADPANNTPAGRIPISSASITMYNADEYWYVSSPKVSITTDSVAPGAFRSYIDYPTSGSTYNGDVYVQGWAILGDGISNVTGWVNGNSFACEFYERTDVAAAYPGYPTGKEGFKATIPAKYLSAGENVITLYAYNNTVPYHIGEVTFTFTDEEAPIISNVQYELDADGYTVTCQVSDNYGIDRVMFPTWTSLNDQDDMAGADGSWPSLEVHKGTVVDGIATFRVNRSEHNNEKGTYTTDIYAFDIHGNATKDSLKIIFEEKGPVLSNIQKTVDSKGYTITLDVSDESEVDRVMFPTWTIANGQDDLQGSDGGWKTLPLYMGTIEDGKVTYRVNISDHNNETGIYETDIYAYDIFGNETKYDQLEDTEILPVIETDTEAPKVTNPRVTEVTVEGFTVVCDIYDNVEVTGVEFIVGEESETYQATIDGDTASCFIPFKNHGYKVNCDYVFTTYAYDAADNSTFEYFDDLYVELEMETYTITYHLDGGTLASGSIKEYPEVHADIQLKDPTKENCTFDGWYTAKTGGEKVTIISSSTVGNLNLYARWIENEPIITDGGIVSVGTITGRPGETVQVPIIMEKNPGIIAAQFKLKYDDAKLKIVKVTDGGILDTPVFDETYIKKPYVLSWGDGILTTDITQTGTIATISFEIIESCEEGLTEIELVFDSAYNAELDDVLFTTVNGSIEVKDCIPGDVNNDGEVKLNDALVLRRYVAGWDVDVNLDAADVNGDGEVKLNDALLLRRYVANWDVSIK